MDTGQAGKGRVVGERQVGTTATATATATVLYLWLAVQYFTSLRVSRCYAGHKKVSQK
jgi:hypothetical protein